MRITKFFIDQVKFSNILLLFIFLIGFASLKSLPRQDSPDVNFDVISIRTIYPGASPEDVEINVTDLIEDELDEVDGLERVTSISVEELSYIAVRIDPDQGEARKRRIKDDVRKAVERVTDFPAEVEDRPFVDEERSSDFPVIEVALHGEGISETELRQVARNLEADLKTIPAVGSVEKIGFRKREVQILCDLDKMEKHYVALSDVTEAIARRNVKLSGGRLESGRNEKKVVTYAEYDTPADVATSIVRSNFSGQQLRIEDIAEVRDDFERKRFGARYNGVDSINLIVKRKAKSDVIDLSADVRKVFEDYQKAYADTKLQVDLIVDYTRYTASLLSIVSNNALIGLVLVIFSLFYFLNVQTALWVSIGIPASVMGAFMFFPMFDMGINQIALIAMILVLGMLVDDAIVVAENINRHQEEGLSFKEAALVGTKEVSLPVTATIITTIVCFVPMFFMSGIMGKFIFSIPMVVVLTLLMSLFESITILPCHLAYIKSVKPPRSAKLMASLKKRYQSLLSYALHHRVKTLALFVITSLCIFIFAVLNNRFILFPSSNFDAFYVILETDVGDSMDEALKKIEKVEAYIERIPKELMQGYKTDLGHHRTDEAMNNPAEHSNWALITVFLKPAAERDVRSEKVVENLRAKLQGLQKEFDFLQVKTFQDGPPVGAPITLNLVSDEFHLCEQYEQQILEDLRAVEGVYALETSNREGKSDIRIIPKYELLAKVGLTAEDISRTVRSAFDGVIASTMRRDGEEIDFRVKLKDDQRGRLEILPKLPMKNNEGKLIRLGDIATFKEAQAVESINHYDGRRSITITGQVDVQKVTASEVNAMIRKKYAKEIEQTPGLKLVFGGEEKETNRSVRDFMIAFACAMLGVYFILVMLLDSFVMPFIIMVAIPFGFVGVLIAFALHGLPMSFMGLIGTLGMIGVVVNDSLVMTTYLNKLCREQGRVDFDLILKGAQTRLRPVLLTTITTVLGLAPTVYGFGGSEPFLVPMVLAMSWGLAFATVITLVFIPVLYSFVKH